MGGAAMIPFDILRGKHSGEDLWIIGSSASGDYVDPEFFRGKTTIGLNLVSARRFPATYSVLLDGGPWVDELAKTGSRLIVSEFSYADKRREKNIYPDAYFFRHDDRGSQEETPIGNDRICVQSTAIAAMHIACEMGARNIILCGFDGGSLNGRFNFGAYPHAPPEFYRQFICHTMKWLRVFRDRLTAKYGVRIYSLNPFAGLTTDGHDFRPSEPPICDQCGSVTHGHIKESTVNGTPGVLEWVYLCESCGAEGKLA